MLETDTVDPGQGAGGGGAPGRARLATVGADRRGGGGQVRGEYASRAGCPGEARTKRGQQTGEARAAGQGGGSGSRAGGGRSGGFVPVVRGRESAPGGRRRVHAGRAEGGYEVGGGRHGDQ
jgi:hypothetical protein